MQAACAEVGIDDFKSKVLISQEHFDPFLKRYDWTYHQLARGEFPAPHLTLEEVQMACLCEDPVAWSHLFMREPDNPDQTYTFWDYQRESIRYQGNTLHECGAEVGKTREIVAYVLWKAITCPRGSGLVTAPMYAHVIEIVDAIIEQLAFSPMLQDSLALHRKHPYHHMRFTNGFKVDFRPTGFDGEALRGVHVRDFAIMDEAAKIKNPDIFKEFWRASKPGCEHRIYSVPDGDRSTVFFRLCQKAGGHKIDEEDNQPLLNRMEFKKYHWSKELMPPPFWTPERQRFYEDQYGGQDSPGYQQNVLGNWGDPENSVFPWHQFQRLLKDIPEYRCMKILVDDSQGQVMMRGMKYAIGIDAKAEEINLLDQVVRKEQFNFKQEIKAFFSHTPGLLFGGGDLGFSQDPTELYVKLIIGNVHRLIARVQLKGVTYDQQCEVIDALDDIFDCGLRKMGWGIDFGNAGSAVVHILQNPAGSYSHKFYEDRLTGFQFGASYDAVDEDGKSKLTDKNKERVFKQSGKELSTDLLVRKMHRQELEYPYDPDIMLFYPNHTYRNGPQHRIFKKEDDHVIDADRVLTLRVVTPGSMEEDFVSGSNLR